METHVKVLGILNIVCGVLGLCGALLLAIVFGGVTTAVTVDGDPDSAVVLPILGLTGITLVLFTVAISLPAIIIGYSMYRMRPWARIGGIVLAILSLIVFPFGTLLGIYGLWVLFSKEGERLFTAVRTT